MNHGIKWMMMWSQARQIFATKKLPFSLFFLLSFINAQEREKEREKEKMDGRNEERRKGSELEMDSNHDRLTSPFLSPDSHSFNLLLFFFLSLSLSSTSFLSPSSILLSLSKTNPFGFHPVIGHSLVIAFNRNPL